MAAGATNQSEDVCKAVVRFLGLVHDIGKATPAFQTMKGYNNSPSLDDALLEKLEKGGFSGASTLFLPSAGRTKHGVAGQSLLHYYGVSDDIATVVGGHHGKPLDDHASYEEQIIAYPTNYFQEENKQSTIRQKWEKEQETVLRWALAEAGFTSVNDLPAFTQPAQVILSGLLIMADWMASNEYYFPLIGIEEGEVENQDERKEAGLSRWKKSDLWHAEYISDIDETYGQRFGFAPREIQARLAEMIEAADNPGIIILEAPMGCGKTEAALLGAEQLAYKSGCSGVFFGLPTQATSNGIFPRIQEWLTHMEEDLCEQASLRLIHGKAHLNEEFLSLARGVNIDDSSHESVFVNEWFSGRKTAVLDDFVVGTVDQFLMAALKQKHLALRHLGFSKKVVIIDEVHAYDAYMSEYLLAAVTWMGAYNVPVIILSATLPAERRTELIRHYRAGQGYKWKKSEKDAVLHELKTRAYPLITYTDGEKVCQIKDFSVQADKQVRIAHAADENLVELVKTLLETGGIVGIIVNTVKRSQAIARSLSEVFGEDTVELLHSAFIATERVRKERELLATIGKGANRPARKIIVGTQVIEQSLDIDFDVLISDLAPMDLLLQRMGRLHRHDIQRPVLHREPVMYVLNAETTLQFEGGASAIYGDYLLAQTQAFLPEYVHMPEDISVLVQCVYGKEEVQWDDDLRLPYEAMKVKHEAYISKKKDKADIYCIKPPSMRHDRTLIGWLKNSNPEESEEKACAQVRDAGESIEVIVLKQCGNGYALWDGNEDISGRIADASVAKHIAKYSLKLPSFLTAHYNISQTIDFLEQYTLAHLGAWQQSPWLKGELGIILDENNEFLFEKAKLVYSRHYGMSVERV